MQALSTVVEAGRRLGSGKKPRVGKCEGRRWRGSMRAQKAAPIECEWMFTVSLWTYPIAE
jgi:hypothetical protein